MRILVLEANTRVFTEHTLRYMKLMLPMDQVEVVHAVTLEAALPFIENQPFDMIIYDYQLGKVYQHPLPVAEGKSQEYATVRHCGDLFRHRAALEDGGDLPKSVHVFFTSTTIASRKLSAFGSPLAKFSKLKILDLISLIKTVLDVNSNKPEPVKEAPLAQEV